ncbi:hypothetical protein MMC21_003662 [Puttea exsequens]|nr:hypothetical protein [Puttea exsequens]
MASEQINGVAERALPKKRNPLLGLDNSPPHEELVKKRRLGRTKLTVSPALVGTNNSTKPENLGDFDYAHLRAPLPPSLKGSEIFAPHQNQPTPEVYFLMRRSSDGFVSATGMFKAAFPWAKHAEENAERDYIKTLPAEQTDEVAGNVWVSEHYAVKLADEYGIVPWVQALLDHAAIQQNHDDPVKAPISPPPHFKFTANDRTHLPPPNGTPARASTPKARGRPRGGSPAKNASPAKSHKKRVTKKEKEADAATARQASEALQSALDDTVSTAAPESSVDGDKARVEVESVVEVKGDKETTMTNVRVEMSSKELQLSENPEEMIAKAKEMVEEVKKIEGESSSGPSKRKAEELDESDDAADNELQPAKRARLLQQALKKEKVRNRAMIGVAATLAIGAIIPFVLPA